MVYLIPLIIILFGIVYYDYFQNRKGRLVLWVLLCLYLILLAGLRYKMGEDTIYYLHGYERMHPLNKLTPEDFQYSRFAPGFIIIFSFFRMLSPEMVYFQLFQALVVNTVFFYFFYKNTRHIFFAGLLYYLFMYILLCFLQMREALAVSVFLLAWPSFRDSQWIKWYIASFVAFSLHMSGGIMFILPLICLPGVRNGFKFGKRTALICLAIVIVAFSIRLMFFKYIELLSLSDKLTERAQAYDKDELGGAILNFKGVLSIIIEYILYPVIALFLLNRGRNKGYSRDYFDRQQAFVLLSIYFIILSFFIAVTMRLTNYFYPFVILLLSDWIFSSITFGRKRIRGGLAFWTIFFLPMIGFHTYGVTYAKINKSGTFRSYMIYYPYNSYLDKNQDAQRDKVIRYIFSRR